jgi:hypothetical protein
MLVMIPMLVPTVVRSQHDTESSLSIASMPAAHRGARWGAGLGLGRVWRGERAEFRVSIHGVYLPASEHLRIQNDVSLSVRPSATAQLPIRTSDRLRRLRVGSVGPWVTPSRHYETTPTAIISARTAPKWRHKLSTNRSLPTRASPAP